MLMHFMGGGIGHSIKYKTSNTLVLESEEQGNENEEEGHLGQTQELRNPEDDMAVVPDPREEDYEEEEEEEEEVEEEKEEEENNSDEEQVDEEGHFNLHLGNDGEYEYDLDSL